MNAAYSSAWCSESFGIPLTAVEITCKAKGTVMDTEISHRGYSITLATLPPHFLNNIKSELLVKPLENPNFPSNDPAYPVYRISKTKIYMPRFYGLEKYSQPKKNILRNGEI